MKTSGKKVITPVLGLTYAPCMDTYTNNFFRCLDRVTCHVMSCGDGDVSQNRLVDTLAGWSLGRQWQNGKERLEYSVQMVTVQFDHPSPSSSSTPLLFRSVCSFTSLSTEH